MGEKRLLELKARQPDLAHAESWCAKHASLAEEVSQTDTYFRVRAGRFKLRIVEGREEGTLIYYDREDRSDAKRSRVSLLPVNDPNTLLIVLRDALGILVEVRKRRRVFRWEKVQIHLDQVEGLGTFLEFERMVDSTEAEGRAKAEFAELRVALGISERDLEAGSYSDMVLERKGSRAVDSGLEGGA